MAKTPSDGSLNEGHITIRFNELLEAVGISPNEVSVIRHHTPEGGKTYATLHDLWRSDPSGFERYQSTQLAERPIFRNRKIWAAFVNPTPEETLFVGLYDAAFTEARKADWLCNYRGDEFGYGELDDIFMT